jgi:hypothetical protein
MNILYFQKFSSLQQACLNLIYACLTEAEFMSIQFRISLRFLGIILRVFRLEVSVYNFYITNQFQTTFAQGGGGVGLNLLIEANSKEEHS